MFQQIIKVNSQLFKTIPNGTTIQRSMQAWSIAQAEINAKLKVIHDEGTWKTERIITSAQGAHIQVDKKPRKIINFCANNYLGLSVRFSFVFF